ncbi:MAG: protein-L-isoaspartate(D-aspartate) O-methyltransferase [Planctomycetota bacterium]|jgi:protein-L-isoaspartate(D-aspartate) O-methyltransferase
MIDLELKERDPFIASRRRMVAQQIEARGLKNSAVLAAMRTVPRHRFVPKDLMAQAYEDKALPLGPQQTISQPYIVALMTELACDSGRERVLEIGTGSGYQAAVLAEIFGEVYSVELDPDRHEQARANLSRLHYKNVHLLLSDGSKGWPEHAPYDAILVTASTREIWPALRGQLRVGGQLIVPVTRSDPEDQMLRVLRRTADMRWKERDAGAVRFVPMRKEEL